MILNKAAADVVQYNRFGLHYNLVASGIYEARSRLEPFSDGYLPYIVAGLIVFDMGRTMGQGAAAKAGGRFSAHVMIEHLANDSSTENSH